MSVTISLASKVPLVTGGGRGIGKAFEARTAGLDWKREVHSRCLSGPALLVARLKANPDFASEEERVKAFTDQGGCRSTYFNHSKNLATPSDQPCVPLKNTAPPCEERAMDPGVVDLLKSRHRRLGHG